MDDKSMDPSASPDLLAPASKRGHGVRRVNRLPLVIVLGLVCVAVMAITYTYYDRKETTGQRQTEQTAPALDVNEAATSPLAPPTSNEIDDYIPPAEPPVSDEALLADSPAAGDPVTDAPRNSINPTVPAVSDRQVADMEHRQQLIQRINETKLADLERALSEDSTIEVGGGTQPPPAAGPIGSSSSMDTGDAQTLAAMQALQVGLPGAAQQDPNGQLAKREFLAAPGVAENYLPYTRTPPIARHELKAGGVIPSVMISGINSDLPGQVIAQVRENVYDTATGRYLLIPMGCRLIGSYDNAVTLGQKRVLLVWTRLIYPDGSSVNLGAMPGADRAGYAGFRDKVNNHYARIYGSAFLLSIFSAGTQLSQPAAPAGQSGGYDAQQILSAELGRQLGQLGIEQSRRNLDVAPTIEIRNGYKFNVMVTKDMVLAPYEQ